MILEIRFFEKKYGYEALNENGFKDLELYEDKLKNYLGVGEEEKEDEEENEGLMDKNENGGFEVIEEVEGEDGSILWEDGESKKKSEEETTIL